MAGGEKSAGRTGLLTSCKQSTSMLTSGAQPEDDSEISIAMELNPKSSSYTFVTFSSFCVFDLPEQLLKELFFHAWQFCFVTILKSP